MKSPGILSAGRYVRAVAMLVNSDPCSMVVSSL